MKLSATPPIVACKKSCQPILVLTEGVLDIEFLTRISRILSAADKAVPDLAMLQQQREIVMLPLGGNGPQPWVNALAAFGRSTFLLFDRETSNESASRTQAVELLNANPRICAYVTSKRAIENYLHPEAIYQASGVSVDFGDDDSVAEIVAQQILNNKGVRRNWRSFSTRTRKRLRDRAKQWLNRAAVSCMTPELLDERDPRDELRSWLQRIGDLCAG